MKSESSLQEYLACKVETVDLLRHIGLDLAPILREQEPKLWLELILALNLEPKRSQ